MSVEKCLAVGSLCIMKSIASNSDTLITLNNYSRLFLYSLYNRSFLILKNFDCHFNLVISWGLNVGGKVFKVKYIKRLLYWVVFIVVEII